MNRDVIAIGASAGGVQVLLDLAAEHGAACCAWTSSGAWPSERDPRCISAGSRR
jgi:hypothetical protein